MVLCSAWQVDTAPVRNNGPLTKDLMRMKASNYEQEDAVRSLWGALITIDLSVVTLFGSIGEQCFSANMLLPSIANKSIYKADQYRKKTGIRTGFPFLHMHFIHVEVHQTPLRDSVYWEPVLSPVI